MRKIILLIREIGQDGWAALLGMAALGTLTMCFSIMFLMGQGSSHRISYYGENIQIRYAAEGGIERVTEAIISNPDMCQDITSGKVTTLLSDTLGNIPVTVYGTIVTDNSEEKLKLLAIGGTQEKNVQARRYIVYDSSAHTVKLDRWE